MYWLITIQHPVTKQMKASSKKEVFLYNYIIYSCSVVEVVIASVCSALKKTFWKRRMIITPTEMEASAILNIGSKKVNSLPLKKGIQEGMWSILMIGK